MLPDSLDLEALVEALEVADVGVRDIYRTLADDPDLATQREAALSELRTIRSELLRQVGLAILARRRAMLAPERVSQAANTAEGDSVLWPGAPANDTGAAVLGADSCGFTQGFANRLPD